jgi:MFS transporter, LPLT family, lysophospholipid transporter
MGIRDSGARYPDAARHPATLVREFANANRLLWRDRQGGLSMAATTIFWGVGATLQFAVLRWATEVLHFGLDRAAYLQAAVALGVVFGAAAAGHWVRLSRAKRGLLLGVLLGLLIALGAWVDGVALAAVCFVAVGALGGFMVVPLNALLQHRGHELLTAGRSIAVQGFNENLSVVVMLAVYAASLALQAPIRETLVTLGLFLSLSFVGLMLWARRVGPGPGPGAGPGRAAG